MEQPRGPTNQTRPIQLDLNSLNMLKDKFKIKFNHEPLREADKKSGYGPVFDSGEELDVLLPNGAVGSVKGSRDYEFQYDCAFDVANSGGGANYEKTIDSEDATARKRHEKDRLGSVSVLEAIAADEKRSDLEHEISQKDINLEKLRKIASMGLPGGGGLRATAWKILLGYLPTSRALWEKELTENRQKYANLKEELLLSPTELTRAKSDSSNLEENAEIEVAGPLKRQEISGEDHPLSDGKGSAWHQFFQHTEDIEQIDRDLLRTHPEMKFFSGDSSLSKNNRVCFVIISFISSAPPPLFSGAPFS
uniref:Uncharacterized protein MANES_14G132800 n=1 Tax=Rhizophora mucronata TaxID=61149 RepID=A0A2P2KDF2_RHIMU